MNTTVDGEKKENGSEGTFRAGLTEILVWKALVFGGAFIVLVLFFLFVGNNAKFLIEQAQANGFLLWSIERTRLTFKAVDLVTVLLAVISALLVSKSAQVAPQPFAMATRLRGKIGRVKGPGWILLIPLLERPVELVDTRVITIRVTANFVITRDGIAVNANANMLVRRNPDDLAISVFEVKDWESAMRILGENTAKAVVRAHSLKELDATPAISEELLLLVAGKAKELGGDVRGFEFSDYEFVNPELAEMYALLAQARLQAEAQVVHAQAEQQTHEIYQKVILSVKPDASAGEILDFVQQLRRLETARQIAQGGRLVPFADMTQLAGLQAQRRRTEE